MTGAVSGSLELVCGRDSSGKPSLRRQYCEPPFHVGKGYVEGDVLTVQVANPAAGVFSGDTLMTRIRVEDDVAMVVKTPAATSLFPGNGGIARIIQNFSVAAGSSLEWCPQPIIPHAGARLRQTMEVNVEDDGRFMGIEIFAPGRVARSEVLAFQSLEIRTLIKVGGVAVARERLQLNPPHTDWIVRRNGWEAPLLGVIWVVSKALASAETLVADLEDLQSNDFLIGATQLSPAVLAVRFAACEGATMRDGARRAVELLSLGKAREVAERSNGAVRKY